MKILGIETSCDETSASVVEVRRGKFTVLSEVVSSQIKIHRKTGGIVPEVAAREHVKNILPVIDQALNESVIGRASWRRPKNSLLHSLKKSAPGRSLSPVLDDVDYLAVTAGPGLITSLMVGVEAAKALSYVFNKKLVAVNHLAGHLASSLLLNENIKLPAVGLVVSGGHTALYLMKKLGSYQYIGGTQDDAAGEAFDKTAKLLGLPYPGGPEISKLAKKGDADKYKMPQPMRDKPNFDFSFSGIKTHVLYEYQKNPKEYLKNINDVAASFEKTVAEILTFKTLKAAKKFKARSIILAGGVAANTRLRKTLQVKSNENGIYLFVPELKYCTDNATMIAVAAYLQIQKKDFADIFKLKANPNWEL